MIVEIDHILIAVPDPDAAAARLAAALGLPHAGGGVHPAIGTRNALLSLGGPYLELIGLADGSPEVRARAEAHPIGTAVRAALRSDALRSDALRSDAARVASREERTDRPASAYASVALRTDDLAADFARLGGAGSPLAADVVRRARPDGSVITWPVAFPPRLGPDDPGFLIEHAPDEPERLARLRAAGPRLAGLSLRVSDPAAVASAWEATLGIRFMRFSPDAPGAPTDLVATIGPHAVVIRAVTRADAGVPAATILLSDPVGPGRPVALGGVRFAWR